MFWQKALDQGALPEAKKAEMKKCLQLYRILLAKIADAASAADGSVSDDDSNELLVMERKLEQLAEDARLESGKSFLL